MRRGPHQSLESSGIDSGGIPDSVYRRRVAHEIYPKADYVAGGTLRGEERRGTRDGGGEDVRKN